MADLLDVAARTLVMGGRLVYIIPSFRDFNPDTDLPRHECLESIHSCYQPFSPELGRRIVVMKKTSSYDPSQRPNYMENVWLNGIESAEKCINIRNKLIEAAKEKPGYEERAEIRKQKRRDNKEAKKLAKKQKKDEESKKTEG
jgi:tRNA (guanine10-N2)-methyltransferase